MKALAVTLLAISLYFTANARQTPVYNHIPDTIAFDTDTIASWLRNNCHSDSARLAALFSWMSDNIRYDVARMYDAKHQLKDDTAVLIRNVLSTRKAVCIGFACTFASIARKAGVPAITVTGYTTNNKGFVSKDAHAWVAVRLRQQWLFIDPTWGAGGTISETKKFLWWKYKHKSYLKRKNWDWFLQPPQQFISGHIPYDPLYQFTAYPVSHDSVSRKSRKADTCQPKFMYNDTLHLQYNLSHAGKAMQELNRIKRYGTANFHVSQHINVLRSNIPYWQFQDDKESGQYDKFLEGERKLTALRQQCDKLEFAMNGRQPAWSEIATQLRQLSADAAGLQQQLNAVYLTWSTSRYKLQGDVRMAGFLVKRIAAQELYVARKMAAVNKN